MRNLSRLQRRTNFFEGMPRLENVAIWLGLGVVALIWIAPFVFMLFTSVKGNRELLRGSPFDVPQTLLWENYSKAWEKGNFDVLAVNSLVITSIKVPVGILVSSLAAFALARIRLRFNNAVFLLLIAGSMIPVQVAIIPLFDMTLKLGLLDTYLGVILPYIAFGIPYQVFLLRGFFQEIPSELDEAAQIDGCSWFGIFWRVVLPLARPILATLFILDFVSTWNEFGIALVLLPSSDSWTIPLGLQAFQGRFATQYNTLNAAVVTSIIPVLIVYILFQRYFVSGLLSGAVKG